MNRPGGDWAPRGTNPFEDDDDHGDDLVEQAAMANQQTAQGPGPSVLEEAEAEVFQLALYQDLLK